MSTIQSHSGFYYAFKAQHLTLGLMMPFDNAEHNALSFSEQGDLAKYAETLGFTSLFVRDSPLYSPKLGPITTNYDPFVFLTYISSRTSNIALGTASIVATLRHPIHIAKATTSLDLISNERLLLGMATGDRQFEFPAFNVETNQLSERYQQTIYAVKALWQSHSPDLSDTKFQLTEDSGLQILPKHRQIPVFATGYAKQSIDWIKQHMDGWLFYPQAFQAQKKLLEQWHDNNKFKPFMHPLVIDLSNNPNELVSPIKGGYRLGSKTLLNILSAYERIGTNHIILNLKSANRTYEDMLQEIGKEIIPYFPPHITKEVQKNEIIGQN
ncbi:LLM class oxidoreductase [Staphylococcus gallinarum]|uniref:LLM class oxidoreductase n=1 Tax=Staphylococcus gallinarum TaxID=1293 RepID=UPI001E561614|nr:LLM class oxidoreductase [Staphylococcus gallinarum]MCD8920182.1 LLM class oxidoreductase [Staphylococcus gallinarum]MEB6278691.1 LLM class oxidoreductase [Staphylococcus gallinarum]UEH02137.1 LLM class oxidoreductase [Staphylococcus gallinarum]